MSSDDRKLDLSALDPTRDRLRFERMVRSVAARAAAQRRADPLGLAVRWWRPALALAAGLALLAWAPSLFGRGESPSSADPASSLMSWATGGGPSSPGEVLSAFGRTP